MYVENQQEVLEQMSYTTNSYIRLRSDTLSDRYDISLPTPKLNVNWY